MNRYEIPSKFDFINFDKETMKTVGVSVGAVALTAGIIYLGYKIGGYIGGKIGEQVEAFAAAATDNSK